MLRPSLDVFFKVYWISLKRNDSFIKTFSTLSRVKELCCAFHRSETTLTVHRSRVTLFSRVSQSQFIEAKITCYLVVRIENFATEIVSSKLLRRWPFEACFVTLMHNIFKLKYTLCLKKVSTFKLSVTLSHLNRFSKFLHCWKAMKFATEPTRHYPTQLQELYRHVFGRLCIYSCFKDIRYKESNN